MNLLRIILVQGFWSLKTKNARFAVGFRLDNSLQNKVTQSSFSAQSHATNIPQWTKHELQLTGRVGCMEPSLDTTIPAAALISLE